MKQVNKDYISVVRSNNGRLLFERIPMIKSDRVKDRLAEFLDDDRATIEDMLEYLQEQPIFKFFALPHYEAHGDIDVCRPEDWVLYELTKSLKEARTKVKFLEEVLKLIEECDYRWNVVRITNGFPDIIIRSHSGYESSYVRIRLNDEVSIVFESYELGGEFEGTLAYTVYKNDMTVRPYRSVVQLFDCSDDILHATKVFDPEEGQWDNALRSLVTTANVILTNPEEYFKRSVIEAGQLMLEKIKQMGDVDVLVSGIRPPSDAELFVNEFGDKFFLVAIVLESDKLRYERMVARGSARDNITYEQFLEFDKREEELFQTSKTMDMANYTFVRGSYSDEVYHEKIREFYLKFCSN